MSEPAFDYYELVNQDVLNWIPPDAGLVVEVGCGAGALGGEYKRFNPDGRYVGIELVPEVAEIARQRLDDVIVGNVEHLSDNTVPIKPGSVDVLVYADVLEHLVDPWSVLKRHAAWLKPDGLVVACIPNTAHWSVLVHLLMGEWPHTDQGLFDRTHLRFFTLDGIRQLVSQAGLNVLDVQTRMNTNAQTEPKEREFLRLFLPLVKQIGLPAEAFAERSRAFQYVLRASKSAPPQRRLLIQTLMAPSPCGRVRILEPDRFSGTIPGTRTVASYQRTNLNPATPGEEKVFVWQRAGLARTDGLQTQRNLLQNGYLTIAELDDDPAHWPEHVEKIHFTLRSCHAVQTSTQPLADRLRSFNPNVAVFPNQIARLPPFRERLGDGPVTLFFGALDREADWQPLMPALNRVLAVHREKIRVKVLHDRAFFDTLDTAAKEFLPFQDYDKYEAALEVSDIAWLPLRPVPINQVKSDLKFIECAAHGVVVLASPTVYEHSIVDGETGLLFRSAKDFEKRLTELIAQTELRRRLAANAYDGVRRNRLLGQHFRERRAWYIQLRDRLSLLNEQLRGRVPELFS